MDEERSDPRSGDELSPGSGAESPEPAPPSVPSDDPGPDAGPAEPAESPAEPAESPAEPAESQAEPAEPAEPAESQADRHPDGIAADEPPLEQPTEELFALEARLRDEGDVPDLDPVVRAALLESDQETDSAVGPAAEPAAGQAAPDGAEDRTGEPEEQPAEPPGGEDTDGYRLPDSAEWELPSETAITAEETAVLADQARNEVRSAVEHARETGRPWDPSRPPRSGDFQEPGKRPRYWWRFLLATLIIVFAFAGATSASVLHVVNDIAEKLTIPKNQRLPAWLVEDAGGGPQTIAILGSDVRTGGGSEKGDPGRSDTTMLLRLDPDTGQIAMLSIPRDLKVNIPGHGTDKFNAAYSYGGTKLTLKTVKQLTGLEVNHVINVDFHGFASLIDAVGCVFVDVDRKYYHSNEGLAPADMYAEIDIDAGYQKLCGPDALEYARYRHTDSDLARASRQQDLLGEVRNRLSFGEIIKRRDELIKAFTDNAKSDISGGDQILELVRLLFDSRDARVVEVKFPATFTMDNGVSYVEATRSEIEAAVDKFLGFKDSPGPIGTLKEGEGARTKARKKQEKRTRKRARQATPRHVTRAPAKNGDGLVDVGDATMELARKLDDEIRTRRYPLPVFYPKRLPAGTIFPEGSRAYFIRDPDKNHHRAYRMVMVVEQSDGLHYFGLQGIAGWEDPPILEGPHDRVRMAGRDFMVYTEGDRVRLVAWREKGDTYWISNSLLLTLTNDQMLGMARSIRTFTPAR